MTTRGRTLAIDGGTPLFAEPRHVGAPNIPNRAGFQRRLDELLDRRWLSNGGPLVREFEEAIAEVAGAAHCVAVSNGTVGLEIAARAVGLSGEVVVPSWTFVATAHALQWQEIEPRFADIDPRTHTLDPVSAASLTTPRTTGIVGVHLFGRPCDTGAIQRAARERDLAVIYDAAHAFGVDHEGRGIGAHGDATVFSFHATKFLNTFEGGAIVTDDESLADQIRKMTNFGFAGRDCVTHLGINGKMTEVAAAMGLAQLESLDDMVEANLDRFTAYQRNLTGCPGIHLLDPSSGERRNYQYVVLEIDRDAAGHTRDELLAALEAENVLARRYFHPGAHRMEPYRSLQPHAGVLLPETERVSDAVLALPTGLSTSLADVDRICSVVLAFGERCRDRTPAAAVRTAK